MVQSCNRCRCACRCDPNHAVETGSLGVGMLTKAYAPASIGNVSVGFDILGAAKTRVRCNTR